MKTSGTTLFLMGLFLALTFTSASAQFNWTKDPNNPVMSGGLSGTWNRHVFQPSVLYNSDSLRYEMWFGASYGPPDWRPYRIGFAVSNDGINWTKLETAVLSPSQSAWDESTVEGQTILRENIGYKMWYTGWSVVGPVSIGYATSPDGITWTKDKLHNPVMGPGTAAWEVGGSAYCTVIPIQGGGYKMWYSGWNLAYTSSQIGYATSTDGITWQRDTLNNPVLTTGISGEWDDALVLLPQVRLFDDGIYYMWYTGSRSVGMRQVGLAYSVDGINWTKYDDPNTTNHPYAESDPVLTPSAVLWDGDYIEAGTVLIEGDTINMWYAGSREPTSYFLWRIGHATSLLEPTSINAAEKKITPNHFVLEQNYPNPFNPSTVINWQLAVGGQVKIVIYNLLGQEVAVLLDEEQNPGYHQIEFDASEWASGVYLYRLEAEGFVQTRKMVLIR